MNRHDSLDRHIPFARLHNVRDLGGLRTADGRAVRWGLLYRADSLGKLRADEGADEAERADWARFRALGPRTVVDLRYDWEIDAKGRVPELPDLAYHQLSIEHRPYDQAALGPDVDPGPYLAERYLEVAHDGVKEIRGVLDVIAASAAADEPLVFHCASGKDRTGLIAALVLALLGVPDDVIIEDFALTDHASPRLRADWRAAHPDAPNLWPGYGKAPAEVMTLFLRALAERYGSVRGYADELLGTDGEFVEVLRGALLGAPGFEPQDPRA
ncbi:tyrosine-protein phosphatase [Streptomyces kanamyceticus]|uniref:Tyrosine-protein phosphatase n=1 Tax=Streptomyces kanamyceticus TaxID=1967 RepID=A0A5J6GD82_STRKN|nr:tyrosine-protein phosphatase [Streptomyces kanamyceticus]QEU91888.1 tyrosine-protein phosphatase [Streptomyces kanamyceticus]